MLRELDTFAQERRRARKKNVNKIPTFDELVSQRVEGGRTDAYSLLSGCESPREEESKAAVDGKFNPLYAVTRFRNIGALC